LDPLAPSLSPLMHIMRGVIQAGRRPLEWKAGSNVKSACRDICLKKYLRRTTQVSDESLEAQPKSLKPDDKSSDIPGRVGHAIIVPICYDGGSLPQDDLMMSISTVNSNHHVWLQPRRSVFQPPE